MLEDYAETRNARRRIILDERPSAAERRAQAADRAALMLIVGILITLPLWWIPLWRLTEWTAHRFGVL